MRAGELKAQLKTQIIFRQMEMCIMEMIGNCQKMKYLRRNGLDGKREIIYSLF